MSGRGAAGPPAPVSGALAGDACGTSSMDGLFNGLLSTLVSVDPESEAY